MYICYTGGPVGPDWNLSVHLSNWAGNIKAESGYLSVFRHYDRYYIRNFQNVNSAFNLQLKFIKVADLVF